MNFRNSQNFSERHVNELINSQLEEDIIPSLLIEVLEEEYVKVGKLDLEVMLYCIALLPLSSAGNRWCPMLCMSQWFQLLVGQSFWHQIMELHPLLK